MPPVGHLVNKHRAHGACRLFICISGVCYGLRRIDPTPCAVIEGWRLRKADGTAYDVGRTEQGCTCDCPDFAFRRDGWKGESCKHIRALQVVGLLGGTP